MRAVGFYEELKSEGLDDLGIIHESDEERARFFAKLDALFALDKRDRWVEALRNADIVAAPVNTMLESSKDPDVLANGYITEVDYPDFDKKLKVHGAPWQFSETPAKAGRAPSLGEHNDEVLGRLGYGAEEISSLEAEGVV